MERDPELVRAMEEVVRWREALKEVQQAIRVAEAEAGASASGGGLWSMLMGAPGEEDWGEEERARVVALRAQREGHRQSLVAAQERLEEVRRRVETGAEVGRQRLQERTREALVGGMDAHAVVAIQELEEVVRRLRRTAGKLIEETRAEKAAQERRARSSRYRRRGSVEELARSFGQLYRLSSGAVSPLGALWVDWARDVEQAERLAHEIGLDLSLPHDGAGGLVALEGLSAELDGMMELLREAQRSLKVAPPSSSGSTASASELGELVAGWDRLLTFAEALDKVAVPGARTVHLLAPMTAWNQQAKKVAALAQRCSVPLVPPVNDGGDLHEFVDGLRGALPGWREELEVLRAMVET